MKEYDYFNLSTDYKIKKSRSPSAQNSTLQLRTYGGHQKRNIVDLDKIWYHNL